MSALGGIFNLDGKPVDSEELIELGTALETHGPDGGDIVVLGSVGFVYRAFHTNRESRLEKQPLTSRQQHVVCWDGRLDNRAELIALLDRDFEANRTDVAIVMAAYIELGLDSVTHLIGDFALSLWDHQARRLVLARDAAGPRPLYYHTNIERIVWSSELMPLLDLAAGDLEINDEYIAGYLARGVDVASTPYRGIHAVPPGFLVLIENGQVVVRRFWGLNSRSEIRYKTDEEYEEHFRSLFRDAVRTRMRVDSTVWATLSGGLDSSSIVCMADEVLKSRTVEASELKTVSYVYDRSTTSDERAFIQSVEEQRGCAGLHLREADHPPLAAFPDEIQLSFPDFLDCFVDRHQALCAAMRDDGARVLLTGHGGDELLCSSANPAPELGDLLLQGRLSNLHRSLSAWANVLKRPYLDLFWRDGLVPLLPPRLQLLCGVKANFELPPWYDRRFVKRMNLRERYLQSDNVFGFTRPTGRDQATGYLSATKTIAKNSYRARGGIEVSHPFLHRPLVEFLQAIPFEQRVRPGEARSLMRRSLKDLLPEKILKRRSKKGPKEALFRAISQHWSRLQHLFEDPRVCAYGYMDAVELRAALERARHGCEINAFPLVQTISLEFWLRALENRSSPAKFTGIDSHF